jgi:hypothetical protein
MKYETALKTDPFLLIVHGTAAEVAKAKEVIETTHPAQLSPRSGDEVAAATLGSINPRARLRRALLFKSLPSIPELNPVFIRKL